MPPIISFVGYSNSGKTTFLVNLISELKQRGYKVGVIKHDGHDFIIDYPQTDTWQHREAGADTVCIASASQLALVKQTVQPACIDDLMQYFEDVDIVLTEGFKQESKPQIEVSRTGIEPLGRKHNTIAVIADRTLYQDILHFSPDDISGVADLVTARITSIRR
ncbi:molybdopterin-guanine dinucleotide biosynthesis protein B [bacterium BFN5]|nr:molybdopterin-guanine dinucleotide biosynthesis protein B [bacterium BFN5]QJW44799.1 molybdopterin-guanine dinucleotide biosynthesis protein B [bacterium BFN5]